MEEDGTLSVDWSGAPYDGGSITSSMSGTTALSPSRRDQSTGEFRPDTVRRASGPATERVR